MSAQKILTEVATRIQKMGAGRLSSHGPHDARGAAIWDVANWIVEEYIPQLEPPATERRVLILVDVAESDAYETYAGIGALIYGDWRQHNTRLYLTDASPSPAPSTPRADGAPAESHGHDSGPQSARADAVGGGS